MEPRPLEDGRSGAVDRLLRRPPWKVMIVTPDGGCCDECGTAGCGDPSAYFGYTVGLFDLFGRPELHCPALSVDDPPSPLGVETLGAVLNDAAARVVTGEVGTGSSFEFTANDGHTRYLLRFALGAAVPPEDVTALMANPDATVIPIRWTVVATDCPCRRKAA
jgi:hypothetical protein